MADLYNADATGLSGIKVGGNGLANTVGILYNINVRHFRITVKNGAGSARDLRAEDDAVNEAVQAILREVSPLAVFIVDDNTGIIIIVADKSQTADGLQTRIRNLGTAVGPNSLDVSGTDVVIASAITNSVGGTAPVEY